MFDSEKIKLSNKADKIHVFIRLKKMAAAIIGWYFNQLYWWYCRIKHETQIIVIELAEFYKINCKTKQFKIFKKSQKYLYLKSQGS
jgi:hypothetical protein